MKLILSYELPFVLAMTVPVMKTGYAVRLGDIILYQQANGPVIASVSGAISFLVMLLCFQAKLGFVPFDIAEAETEITAGPYIEYSGKALAIFKIAKAILYFIAPAVLMTLYFGGIRLDAPAELAKSVLRYVGIVVLIVLIKNTNPRVRIDHAMRFFWRHATVLAAASIALAYMGL
jgi:NADH-quinone oxidoreductase subunit H